MKQLLVVSGIMQVYKLLVCSSVKKAYINNRYKNPLGLWLFVVPKKCKLSQICIKL